MQAHRIHRHIRKSPINKGHKKPLWIDRKLDRHIQIMALLFFIGFALIIGIGSKTLTTWNIISRLFFAIAVITSFTPKSWLPVIYRFRKEMKVLLTLFALTPMITGMILLANFTILTEKKFDSYNVINTIYYPNDYLFKVVLEDNKFEKNYQLRTFSLDNYNFRPDSAHYEIGTGIFTFKVIRNKYLTP